MSEHVLFDWFVEHLPDFDPAWPAAIQSAWMDCLIQLWRWGCRIEVEAAAAAGSGGVNEGGLKHV